jgi:hypothetical protein
VAELHRRAETPLRALPTILFAAIPALVVGAFLLRGIRHELHGNASGLFYFGDAWLDGAALPRDALVRKGPGYDGQFYYRVAADPWLPLARLTGASSPRPASGIDTPAYRYRRIAYPLAARLAALGTTDGLVWSFPLVSVFGVWLGVFSASRLFETYGRQRWWGWAYAMMPGVVFSASRNLCEGLAIALVSAALLALARRRRAAAIGLLTIAHLAHETTVLVSCGCFLQALLATRAGRVRDAAPFLLPIVVTLLWAALVAAAFPPGVAAVLSPSGSEGLGIPLAGIAHKVRWLVDPEHAAAAYTYLPRRGRFWKQEALLVPPILLAVGVLSKAASRREAKTWITGLVVSLFVLLLGDEVWRDAASYARVTSLALLLALCSFAESPDLVGYGFLASLPFGFAAALGWCADSWRGWFLG